MASIAKTATGTIKTASVNSAKAFVPNFPKGGKAFMSELTLNQAFNQISSIGSEREDFCIKKEELANYLMASYNKKFQLNAYDGFEPSGRMHIAQGLMKTINVNKLTESGVKFTFLVADWFAQLNEKMGGDLKKIRKVGSYFIEVWKACGMNLDKVQFVWSSEEINKRPDEYWSTVMQISRANSIQRVKRCGQIMGRHSDRDENKKRHQELIAEIHKNRAEDAALSLDEFTSKYPCPEQCDQKPVSQLLYPLMQCADIFFLKAHICQLGADQLKVNMLAREYAETTGEKKLMKPVIISHPMLLGLKEGQEKMSKSDPDSAIFMEDTSDDVKRKIKKAFCRPGDVETNPVFFLYFF